MRFLLLISLLLFTLTGCQDKEQAQKEQTLRDAQIKKQVRLELEQEFAHKEAELQHALEEKEAQLAEQKLQHKKNSLNISTRTAEAPPSKLSDIGIHFDDGVISIDTNKSKDFLKKLRDRMHQKMNEVNTQLEKGIVDIKDAGIEMNNEHINIDLNKTKQLLDMWNEKMQVFVKQVDTLTQEIDNNITTKGN